MMERSKNFEPLLRRFVLTRRTLKWSRYRHTSDGKFHRSRGTQTEINKMSIFDTSLMFEQFRTTIGKSRVGCRRPPLFNYK